MGRPGGRFDRKLDLYETIAVVASYLLMVVVSFRFVSFCSLHYLLDRDQDEHKIDRKQEKHGTSPPIVPSSELK